MAKATKDIFFILIIALKCCILYSEASWVPDVQPNIHLELEEKEAKSPVFFGNITDYFKILDQNENTILIGAKNAVYNLSLNGLRENSEQRLEWSSSGADRELCTLKGKSDRDCQNYIRVFARINNKRIMICGTNSYKPRCRYYNLNSNSLDTVTAVLQTGTTSSGGGVINQQLQRKFSYEVADEKEAQGRCPYNPTHNSTYIYTDGHLYSATVADFSSGDPLIYREPQRTEQYDIKQLNQPAFVSALERNGYVFFFFREISMEYMNCGKSIYSRVGRVCKNDKGGPYTSSDRWTSFLKSRLNCSVPGEYPFYFDEIQATSLIIDGKYGGNRHSLIYGVFTTSINAIPGSAICAFTLDSILNSFEGNFKYQKDINSNWLPLPMDKVPEPRPGKCVDDSRTLSSSSVNFVKTHPLMESAVPPLYGQPLVTRVNFHYRLTSITVDQQVIALDGTSYDVLFAGTDNGKVIKFIYIPPTSNNNNADIISNEYNGNINNDTNSNSKLNTNDSTGNVMESNNKDDNLKDYNDIIGGSSNFYSSNDNVENDDLNGGNARGKVQTIVISEIQALPVDMPVRELTIVNKIDKVIVVGNGKIISVPLYHCSLKHQCRDCLLLQDPYCVWDINNQECTMVTAARAAITNGSFSSHYIQNIRNLTKRHSKKHSTKLAIASLLCDKYDELGNRGGGGTAAVAAAAAAAGGHFRYHHHQQQQLSQQDNKQEQQQHPTRGTVSSIGSMSNDNENSNRKLINNISETRKYVILKAVNSAGLKIDKSNDDDDDNDDAEESNNIVSSTMAEIQTASSNIFWGFAGIILIVVFAVGILVGLYSSKRLCKNSPFHAEHHNQLSSKTRAFHSRNTSKDVNLLMNTNAFNQRTTCNNKKDNLENEFVVNDKDRSHESKNSSENLEKGVRCKTGTLTKVKRTYI